MKRLVLVAVAAAVVTTAHVRAMISEQVKTESGVVAGTTSDEPKGYGAEQKQPPSVRVFKGFSVDCYGGYDGHFYQLGTFQWTGADWQQHEVVRRILGSRQGPFTVRGKSLGITLAELDWGGAIRFAQVHRIAAAWRAFCLFFQQQHAAIVAQLTGDRPIGNGEVLFFSDPNSAVPEPATTTLLGVGLIDESWSARLPPELAARLREVAASQEREA